MSGTFYIAQVRFTRRFQHWFPNDIACFPLAEATRIVNMGYAIGLPPPVEASTPPPVEPTPQRQPSQVVRK